MARNKSGYVNTNELAVDAARIALKLFRQEEKEKVKKKSLHNIGLLMEHYLDFKEHYEKIKYRTNDIEDYFENLDIDVTDYDDISVEAIKRSKKRTYIIITQIQTAMKMLKQEMESKDEYEKYRLVTLLYMDEGKKHLKFNPRVQVIAEEIKCGEATVRRWNNEMLNKLAIKLFGVDGLKLDF